MNKSKENKTEIWMDIPQYEGRYQISNCGNVKSLSRMVLTDKASFKITKSRILCPFCGTTSKYLQIQLGKDGVNRKFLIHRLVAMVFLKTWDKNLEVNHLDGDKFNNHADNLEMCSRQHNIDHSILNNLKKDYGENSVRAKLTNEQAGMVRGLFRMGVKQVDIASIYNVSKQTICDIVNFKTYIK